MHLVVLDPPVAFADAADGLGFSIVAQVWYGALGVVAYRLRAPAGETVESATAMLLTRIPGLLVADDDLPDMDTTSALPTI